MRGKQLKSTEEILREQLEKAIAEQETLRKEKEALKNLVVALVKRLIELEQ